ncbi:hypothetical protein Pen01_06030 [Phytomonospora endophytica]|nr:hypothetical protein Pen01_06030 [Phytomonospora endophytica]
MALPGIETGILRAAGKAIGWITPKARVARKRRDIREHTRALTPLAIGEATLAELDGDRQARLAAFIATPDFEQLALQLAVAETQTDKTRGEFTELVKIELWHGLKRELDVKEDLLYRLRDLVFDALDVAVISAVNDESVSTPKWPVIAHMAAAAVRNGELLGTIGTLADVQRVARALRRQVALAHAEIRLPHTGVNRAVPWGQLYVDPILSSDHDFVDIDGLSVPGTRTVILGDPGAGKSTLTEKLAHDIATTPDDQRVPFRVVLRELSEVLRTEKIRLAEHLSRTAAEPYNVALAPEAVEYLLLNGRAVVILDGLDELTDIALRSRLARLVESFATMYPTVPIIVTSRKIGYREAPLNQQAFRSVQIAAMDDDRVHRYTNNWFALDESMESKARASLHKSFIAESESIRDLRSNPLMLSLLCATYSAERYIPRNRALVYEKCALLVFDSWDRMRGIDPEHRFHGYVRGAVQELAWRLFTDRGSAQITRTAAKRIIVDQLVGKGFREEEADVSAEGFLDFCAGRAWVLAEVGTTSAEPIYGFAHRTFLEYFTAEHLVRHHPEPAGLRKVLAPHVATSEWEVVAQLSLQLLARNRHDGAEDFIAAILTEGPPSAAIVSFLSRISGELVLAPKTLWQIADLAIESVLSLPLTTRVSFWPPEDLTASLRTDQHLVYLLNHSLEDNRPHIRRHLESRIAEENTAGNTVLQVAWEVHRAMSFGEHEAFDSRKRDALRLQDGPVPAYRWFTYDRSHMFPAVGSVLCSPQHRGLSGEGIEERALPSRLMNTPTPWLPRAQWRQSYESSDHIIDSFPQFDPEAAGGELGAQLVVGLPYLETADSRAALDHMGISSVPLAAALVEMRRSRDPELPLPSHCLPPDILDFLLRWARHEFSVIG